MYVWNARCMAACQAAGRHHLSSVPVLVVVHTCACVCSPTCAMSLTDTCSQTTQTSIDRGRAHCTSRFDVPCPALPCPAPHPQDTATTRWAVLLAASAAAATLLPLLPLLASTHPPSTANPSHAHDSHITTSNGAVEPTPTPTTAAPLLLLPSLAHTVWPWVKAAVQVAGLCALPHRPDCGWVVGPGSALLVGLLRHVPGGAAVLPGVEAEANVAGGYGSIGGSSSSISVPGLRGELFALDWVLLLGAGALAVVAVGAFLQTVATVVAVVEAAALRPAWWLAVGLPTAAVRRAWVAGRRQHAANKAGDPTAAAVRKETVTVGAVTTACMGVAVCAAPLVLLVWLVAAPESAPAAVLLVAVVLLARAVCFKSIAAGSAAATAPRVGPAGGGALEAEERSAGGGAAAEASRARWRGDNAGRRRWLLLYGTYVISAVPGIAAVLRRLAARPDGVGELAAAVAAVVTAVAGAGPAELVRIVVGVVVSSMGVAGLGLAGQPCGSAGSSLLAGGAWAWLIGLRAHHVSYVLSAVHCAVLLAAGSGARGAVGVPVGALDRRGTTQAAAGGRLAAGGVRGAYFQGVAAAVRVVALRLACCALLVGVWLGAEGVAHVAVGVVATVELAGWAAGLPLR